MSGPFAPLRWTATWSGRKRPRLKGCDCEVEAVAAVDLLGDEVVE